MVHKTFKYYTLLVITLCTLGNVYGYTHRVDNNTNFPIRVSMDYSTAFCKNEKAVLIPPKGKYTVQAGACLLTGIIPWIEMSDPRAKAIPGLQCCSKAAHWSHIGYGGDGVWTIGYNEKEKRLTISANLHPLGDIIGEGLKNEIGFPLASLFGRALAELADLFDKQTPPPFCYQPGGSDRPPATILPTINDPTVQKEDTDGMNPLLRKFVPIVYLAPGEMAMPIRAEEYFLRPNTSMVDKDKKGAVVIPKGQVTFRRIWEEWKKNPQANYYFDQPDACLTRGSNPALNKNPNGTLNVPVLARVWKDQQYIYLRYVFFYGFNAPYPIRALLQAFIPSQARDIANAHIADLEHFTIVLDIKTQKPVKVYYGSHGAGEGAWVDAGSTYMAWEGTHPVVYIAKGGHGTYPESRVYVRVYGFANDITGKGTRWEPQIVRVYPNDDKRFNPDTMGWTYHAGQYSKDGVGTFYKQFGNELSGDRGDPNRPYSKFLRCDVGDSSCVDNLATHAAPPD